MKLLQNKMTILLLLLLIFEGQGFAVQHIKAPAGLEEQCHAGDSLFAKHDYHGAAVVYEQAVAVGVSAVAYYNLGNAYYRQNDLPRAILNYERALKYEPAMADAQYNLSLCRTKLGIVEAQPKGMFFITWAKAQVRSHSVDTWGACAFAAFVVLLLGLLLLVTVRRWRAFCLVFSLLALVVMMLSIIAAALQYHHFISEVRAVVMKDANVTPDDGKKQVAVAGTTVTILDESPDGKILVEKADGTLEGWMSAKNVVKI